MAKFIIMDFKKHRADLINLSIAHSNYYMEQYKICYNIDLTDFFLFFKKFTLQEEVERHIDIYKTYNPPDGICYLIEEDGIIVGKGALKKFNEEFGEIKEMFIKPEFRGNGYGKLLVKKLLKKGKEFGNKGIYLDTRPFMTVALHIYRSEGFEERDEYQEFKGHPILKPYMIYMEKKI
ncbi:hypothetical protein LCGC14_1880230 [marine sediment metagenome]|uniref:N-acetyltransferase domain-containing protein n=1 Tax=marine sediment metagenome TaxID=412755 RepID=A0A0F9IGJ0_9ZZZZ